MDNNELYHHGVKGMKWGVRRKRVVSAKKSVKTKASIKKQRAGFIGDYQKERERQKKHLTTKRAVDLGSRFVNEYTKYHDVTLNGKHVGIPNDVKMVVNKLLDYKYMNDTFK